VNTTIFYPANRVNFFSSTSLLQVLSLLVVATMMFTFLSPVLETRADETTGGATIVVGITIVTGGVVAALATPVVLPGALVIGAGAAIIGVGARLWEEDISS